MSNDNGYYKCGCGTEFIEYGGLCPSCGAKKRDTLLERYRDALEEIAVYPGLAQEIARNALEGE
jgi:hypothetical protein